MSDWAKACEWCKGYPTTLTSCACPPTYEPSPPMPEHEKQRIADALKMSGLNSVVAGSKPTAPDRPSNKVPVDPVNHPVHYQGKVETIDAIESALGTEGFAAYCRGNAIKYLSRLGKKGDAGEDARKAQWYINRLVEALP